MLLSVFNNTTQHNTKQHKTTQNNTEYLASTRLRYKDNLKATLKSLSIPVDSWEVIAADRPQWRGAVHLGAQLAETRRSTLAASKREARKVRDENPAQPSLQCSTCGRWFRARIGLISHARTHKDD
ncbi:Hypp1692 [Branchiostoma lanceolatum]|uniref:Hypp1692 protein n=1 Tax=Branchiostoma lanceolatum TaxID=7740 RepID=A0A8J9ZJU5_BRALA|nr:Hypp1692 [Branchiostoma lanceolatum]